MPPRVPPFLALASLLMVGSCVQSDSPTQVNGPVALPLSISPAVVESPANAGALPITRIRLRAVRVADEVVVGETEVDLVRGPLDNVFVTGVSITESPDTIYEGASAVVRTEVTTSADVEPVVYLTPLDPTLSAGDSEFTSVSLEETLPDGDTLTITSSSASVLLAPDGGTAGSRTLELVGPFSSASFYIQALEDFTGQVTLTASAPGFTDGESTTTVVQPGVRIRSVQSSMTTLSDNDPIWADVGPQSNGTLTDVQPVRAAGPTLTVTFTSSDAAAARLVTSADAGETVTASIAPQSSRTPTTVGDGGVAIDPLEAGSTVVSVSASGFVSGDAASQSVTIDP